MALSLGSLRVLFSLFQVPTSQPTRLFSFMNPLAVEIWLAVLAAYVLVSLTMFIVARFSPNEWVNPHHCDPESDVIANQFSMSDSFWFTIGTLMQQGSDLNPKVSINGIICVLTVIFCACRILHSGFKCCNNPYGKMLTVHLACNTWNHWAKFEKRKKAYHTMYNSNISSD